MIFCEKESGKYVDQNEECICCIFYKADEDSCIYEDWFPGLKKGKDESNTD